MRLSLCPWSVHRCGGILALLTVALFPTWSASFQELGRWPGVPWREPYDLHVVGDKAYVGTREGLMILDLRDPASPTYVNHLDCAPNGTMDVFCEANTVVVAAYNAPLVTVDVQDPENLSADGQVDLGSDLANAMAVYDGVAYLSYGAKQFAMVDVSDVTAPIAHTERLEPRAYARLVRVGVVGYVGTLEGLEVFDFTAPKAPVLLGAHALGEIVESVALHGSRALVATQTGLRVLNVSDPTQIEEEALVASVAPAKAVRVHGGTAYVAVNQANHWNLVALDVQDPSSPQVLGEYDVQGSFRAMDLKGTYVLAVTAPFAGGMMEVIDFSAPENPVAVARWEGSGAVQGLSLEGDWLLAACGAGGLKVLDVSDPSLPTTRATVAPGGVANCVVQQADRAYYGESYQMQILDLQDPTQPSLLGAYVPMGMGLASLEVIGDRVYLLTGQWGMGEFEVVDVSNVESPQWLGSYYPMGDVYDLSVSPDGWVFLAMDFQGLQMVDARDPSNLGSPTVYSTVAGVKDVELRVEGSDLYGYLAGRDGLAVVDFSEVTAPVVVGEWTQLEAQAYHVAVSGDWAYLSNAERLWALDIRNRSAPSEAAQLTGVFSALEARGETVYAVSGGELVILSIGQAEDRPTITLESVGESVVVDWAAFGSGWTLERCLGGLETGGWEAIAGSAEQTQWPMGADGTSAFYRLVKP